MDRRWPRARDLRRRCGCCRRPSSSRTPRAAGTCGSSRAGPGGAAAPTRCRRRRGARSRCSCCTPEMALNVVVLPAPFGPIRPTIVAGVDGEVDVTNGVVLTEPDVQRAALRARPLRLVLPVSRQRAGKGLERADAARGGLGAGPLRGPGPPGSPTVSQWVKSVRAPMVASASPSRPARDQVRHLLLDERRVGRARPSR